MVGQQVSLSVKSLVGLMLACALAAGAIGVGAPARAQVDEELGHARSLSRAFRRAAENTVPTVVKIETRTKSKKVSGRSSRGENPFKGTPLEEFFSDELGERFFSQPFSIPPRSGIGSGVIIDPSGIILTNNHVVEGADEVIVKLEDGREFKSSDIKHDELTDLAVVRIKPDSSLPAAKLGDSDSLEIGDWVIAVGNPFEQEFTVTAGIISGKGRQVASGSRTQFLQTDAAINPGNSGGPLVSLDGDVVGINTAIASNSGGYQGVGFAIPINVAKRVAEQLDKHGRVERAYLGVAIRPVSAQLSEAFNVPRNKGALITEVYPSTPAAEAGFQAGDLVVEFAGQPVRSPSELQELVETAPLDSKQRVKVLRDGRNETLSVVVKSLPEDFGQVARDSDTDREVPGKGETYSSDELGFEVAELTRAEASQHGFAGQSGLLVTNVDEDGVAYEARLRTGMLILAVGRQRTPVTSIDEFKEAIEKESLADGVRLLVRDPRGGQDFLWLKSTQGA